jgi:hypothetical protein
MNRLTQFVLLFLTGLFLWIQAGYVFVAMGNGMVLGEKYHVLVYTEIWLGVVLVIGSLGLFTRLQPFNYAVPVLSLFGAVVFAGVAWEVVAGPLADISSFVTGSKLGVGSMTLFPFVASVSSALFSIRYLRAPEY